MPKIAVDPITRTKLSDFSSIHPGDSVVCCTQGVFSYLNTLTLHMVTRVTKTLIVYVNSDIEYRYSRTRGLLKRDNSYSHTHRIEVYTPEYHDPLLAASRDELRRRQLATIIMQELQVLPLPVLEAITALIEKEQERKLLPYTQDRHLKALIEQELEKEIVKE